MKVGGLGYLAVKLGATFRFGAIPVEPIVRVLGDHQWSWAEGAVDAAGEFWTPIDLRSVLDPCAGSKEGHAILVHSTQRAGALLAERAVAFFGADERLIRRAPKSVDPDDVLSGYLPLATLRRYLVARAEVANRLARSLLALEGGVRLEGGMLWLGERSIEEDHSIVDRVNELTGYGCTLFRGDIRVSTTVSRMSSDKRAVGTRANAAVVGHTLERGRTFRGITRTLGRDWAIVYTPLTGKSRHIIGMIATFLDVSMKVFPVFNPEALLAA